MDENETTPEKKLYIDEDWKSQVEREQEAARHGETRAAESQAPDGASGRDTPLPPANFQFLIGTLYLQGAMALGLLPNAVSNKTEINTDQAKYAIDILAMLQAKTQGNRTPEESAELDEVLHQLRMAYVGASNSAKPSA